MVDIDLLLARYNARLQVLAVGTSSIELYVPDMDAVKKVFEETVSPELVAGFPFWARLWPSSIALSEYITAHDELFAGKHIIEIAGGLGLPSLTASLAAAEVLFTDIDTNAVALFSKVSAINRRSNVSSQVLDWNFLPDHLACDVLLLSDVNYNQQSFEALHALIRLFLERGSLVLLSTPMRLVGRTFIEPLMSFVIDQDVRTVCFDGHESMITILGLKKMDA